MNDGIGGDWISNNNYNMALQEVTSAGLSEWTRKVNGSWGNGGILSNDTFDSWTAEGHTYSWVTGKVSTTDAAPYTHELWVTNSANDKTGNANVYWNDKGGLAVRLSYANQEDDSLAVTGTVYAFSDTSAGGNNTPQGQLTVASFSLDGYNGIDWLTTQMFVNQDGFELYTTAEATFSDELAGAVVNANGMSMSWADINAALAAKAVDTGNDEGEINASVFGSVRMGDLLSHQSSSNTGGIGSTDLVTVETGNTVIPEPATLSVLGLGLVSLIRRRRN
ncbi:MAG: PEP-CTERM sorting domain-containing protein [Phycisphaerae bacterium]